MINWRQSTAIIASGAAFAFTGGEIGRNVGEKQGGYYLSQPDSTQQQIKQAEKVIYEDIRDGTILGLAVWGLILVTEKVGIVPKETSRRL
jgi:hypothetical protein